MTITEARNKMQANRKKARVLLREASELQAFIRSKGGVVNLGKAQTKRRNMAIYKQWTDGADPDDLARKYHLHVGTIRMICRRVQAQALHNYK